jgi:hypothetical protein
MFRKLTFALIATAALGAAALAPTSASAFGHFGGGHGGYGGLHRGYGGLHRDFRRWGYRGWDHGPGLCYYYPYLCDVE